MAIYTYVACEDSGRKHTGTVEAPDFESALAAAAARGAHILEISEEGKSSAFSTVKFGGSVSRADLALFTRRLADLSAAGLPLDRALQITGEQSDNPTLRTAIEEALIDVRGGLPVSEALGKHPKLFPPVFTMTLTAGEASGQFSQVASRLAEFQAIEVKRRNQIGAAMVYPAILASAAVTVVGFLMFFVIPRLKGVFKDLGGDLPLSTQLLMNGSAFLFKNLPIIFVVLVAGFFLYQAWIKTELGAIAKDKWVLEVPTIGKVIAKASMSRYARVLGTVLYGGVPMLEALSIAGRATGNRYLEAASLSVQNEVRDGRRIADAMRDAEAFPSIVTQMMSVGEETGDRPLMLNRISESLDFEVDNSMQKLVAIVEPGIVLVMGGVVGFVVISVLLPIYQSLELVK